MEILTKALQLILSLSLLVIAHEMGHFFFAKLFKTRVEKFYLFFNPWFSLFKFKKGETEYGIGWLPLGGYVKISGMIDESMDKEQLKNEPQSWEFRSKKTWQRLLIMLGGVMVNVLAAYIIYSMVLFAWGEKYLPVSEAKYGIMVDSTGLKMGLQNGDHIYAIDNQPVDNFRKIAHDIIVNKASVINVERNGQKVDVSIPSDIWPELINNPGFIEPRIPFIIESFPDSSLGKSAGLTEGDKIISFNNQSVRFYDEVRTQLRENKNKTVQLAVLRNADTINLSIHIPADAMLQVFVLSDLSKFFNLKEVNYSFFGSFAAGFSKTFTMLDSYIKQFKLLFSPETKAYESLGGFISIGKIFPGEWDWYSFWSMTAFLSIILAFMNVLPIPALDGGHVLFLLYEMITRRKPSDKFMEYAQMTGMILLLALLVYANGNDIIKIFK